LLGRLNVIFGKHTAKHKAETYGAETYGAETYGAETYGFRTFPAETCGFRTFPLGVSLVFFSLTFHYR
jgi:hypothetical protein